MEARLRVRSLCAMVIAATGLGSAVPLHGQTAQVVVHQEMAPADLSPAVAAAIGPGGQRVSLGQTTLDFWWVKSVGAGQAGRSSADGWGDVPEGALLGVLRIQGMLRDIRGRLIKAGTYTLRFALQPTNGDHLGVSPFREFLVVSPASADMDDVPAGHDRAVAMAKQSIGSSHPGVLSIDPLQTEAPAGTIRTNDAGHQAVVVEVSRAGLPPLRFGVVVVGRIDA